MDSAQALFSNVMQRSLISFTKIFTFRQTAYLAIGNAAPDMQRIERRYVELAFSPSNKDKYFTDPEKALELFGGPDQLASTNAERRAAQFTSMVEGASLIYAHSLLDGIAYDLCECIAMISPLAWRTHVEMKKVALKDVIARSRDDLERELVDSYLTSLERESLPKKVEALFSVCHPKKDFSPFVREEPQYAYDSKRLCKLDDQRHDLVHGLLPISTSVGTVELEYMQKTALYLAAMVSASFGVKADPMQIVQTAD